MKKQFNDSAARPLIRKESGSLVFQEDIKRSITIIPELEALIPPLSSEEFTQLEANIVREGCREPLQIWQTIQSQIDGSASNQPVFVLVDGHNRLRICRQHAVDFKLLVREFSGLEAVRESMIDNQLGRRNLTPEQMAYLRGLKYLNTKRTSGRPTTATKKGGQSSSISTLSENDDIDQFIPSATRTEDQLAHQYNVSPKTIRMDASYAKGIAKLAEPLRREVLSRNTKVSKKDIIQLGDALQLDSLIETPIQLQAVLNQQSVKTNSSPNQLRSVNKGEKPDKLNRQITKVIHLATALGMPNADIKLISQQLLNQVQHLITHCESDI
ncbi:ParB N-terminal domain-containing protein [Spirosoma pulveris]